MVASRWIAADGDVEHSLCERRLQLQDRRRTLLGFFLPHTSQFQDLRNVSPILFTKFHRLRIRLEVVIPVGQPDAVGRYSRNLLSSVVQIDLRPEPEKNVLARSPRAAAGCRFANDAMQVSDQFGKA